MYKPGRKLAFALIVALLQTTGFAQKTIVTKSEVDRILKNLSADDKMGRSATDPATLEKSVVFIESEFKRIGLSPLDGLTSFRQSFTKEMIGVTGVEVIANAKSVEPKNILVYSSNEAGEWSRPGNVHRIRKADNLFQTFRKLSRDTTDAFVLVDTAHTAHFRALQEWLSKKRILNAGSKSGSKLFVLSNDTVVSTLNAKFSQEKENIVMTNVVGQIKAAQPTKESVIFSAHYDHIGILPPVDGDSIANGADDDASGTTAVIMLADHFKREKKLTRNLIFVAFTAEEIGGFGSQYFSTNVNPNDVVAMFNIEMIGKPSKWGANAAFISGFERSDFGAILQQNLKGSPVNFHPDPYPDQNLFYRSDNATLARLGVPAHTISTDQIDIDKLYHTVNDEFETINTQNMTEIIRAIAMSASSIVKGTARPTRIDTSKVD
ncbi:MAG TPA: M20/M25/M40 family metallo-hydrolase [Sphingobacteriaceae bacterium]